METKLKETIAQKNDELVDAHQEYIRDLEALKASIDRELSAHRGELDGFGDAVRMPSTSISGDLMCLSKARDAQNSSDKMGRLSETLRILNYIARS